MTHPINSFKNEERFFQVLKKNRVSSDGTTAEAPRILETSKGRKLTVASTDTQLQEIVERAQAAETEQQRERALSLLHHAVEVIREGLQLDVPTTGLGPKADSNAAVKHELTNLHKRVMNRLKSPLTDN